MNNPALEIFVASREGRSISWVYADITARGIGALRCVPTTLSPPEFIHEPKYHHSSHNNEYALLKTAAIVDTFIAYTLRILFSCSLEKGKAC